MEAAMTWNFKAVPYVGKMMATVFWDQRRIAGQFPGNMSNS